MDDFAEKLAFVRSIWHSLGRAVYRWSFTPLEQLLAYIVELRARTTDLKRMIAHAQGDAGDKLREGIYQLEAAIYVMERNAADAYRAQTMKAGEAQA